jgi:poly(3-hydroxybutyrate) depolymerase
MKNVVMIAIVLVMAFALAVPAKALGIPVSNNVYIFEAGAFEAVDGWYNGEILVTWHGNGNNTADLTWAGNVGEVIVTPYTVVDVEQRTGALGIKIQQTVEEQAVVFTLTKINNEKLDVIVTVPALYNGPISFDVLRTANNPGYYFSGALINMGVTLTSAAVDKDSFYAKARVTEYNGSVQGSFGNFGWDPEKESYALGDGWARWNIVDAYVADADGNKVDKGTYVKFDIEWQTRTVPSGASSANRYDVPATRAAWYTDGGYIAFATIELDITQAKVVPGIAEATYVQGETRHDPIFASFKIADAPGGGTYSLYTPENASADNKRPILVWFHGTGERYTGGNPGGNLVGNRALSFADEQFQEALGGAYVLAPQSTTAGWNASRLADMEALIHTVVAENHVDPNRIYVGGLSMGTVMTTVLITSQSSNQVNYAASILCSGGSLNAAQAAIVASKGFPVYLVSSTSDWAAFGQPTALANLLAAGVDAKMKRYPAGPVFDGTFYFGAHDAWNYIYNNLVVDEAGENIFEWLAKQSR